MGHGLKEEVPDRGDASDEEIASPSRRPSPDGAVDNCVTAEGERVSALDLYETPSRAPIRTPSATPRPVAGAALHSDILKCQLQSVPGAVEAGVYGDRLTDEQVARLKAIFPDVCDWAQPGQAPTSVRRGPRTATRAPVELGRSAQLLGRSASASTRPRSS